MVREPLSRQEAAKILGISPQLLGWYAKHGRIPTVVDSKGEIRYVLDQIKDWAPVPKKMGAPKKMLIDLLAIEYANTPEDPNSPFDRVTRSLCSLLDKIRVIPPGQSGEYIHRRELGEIEMDEAEALELVR